MLETVDFMTSRGVTVEFILQAFSVYSFKMWQPDYASIQMALVGQGIAGSRRGQSILHMAHFVLPLAIIWDLMILS